MSKIVRRKTPEPDVSEPVDNGRRGEPLPGCDCVQCFGYCKVDPEARERDTLRRADERERATVSLLKPLP